MRWWLLMRSRWRLAVRQVFCRTHACFFIDHKQILKANAHSFRSCLFGYGRKVNYSLVYHTTVHISLFILLFWTGGNEHPRAQVYIFLQLCLLIILFMTTPSLSFFLSLCPGLSSIHSVSEMSLILIKACKSCKSVIGVTTSQLFAYQWTCSFVSAMVFFFKSILFGLYLNTSNAAPDMLTRTDLFANVF